MSGAEISAFVWAPQRVAHRRKTRTLENQRVRHPPGPTSGNTYKFTGKERDSESGLDCFEARYYSSQYGRFMSPDEFPGGPVDAISPADPAPPGPLPYADITNPQSLNKYAYTY